MREDIRKIFDKAGVSYYNIDNKDNRDNSDDSPASSSDSEANASQSHTESILSSCQETAEPKDNVAAASPTPEEEIIIDENYVHRALFTFFDNGEGARQRYKLQVRINPSEAPSEAVEFIATLTKDRRNFKKHLPEGAEQILEFADYVRDYVKQRYNTYPYIGKFHLNHKWNSQQEQRNTNEPYCACAVWWDGSGWSYALMMYDWHHEGTLTKQGRTPQQIKKNVMATDYWQNPTHNTQKRNPTFRDQRRNKQ